MLRSKFSLVGSLWVALHFATLAPRDVEGAPGELYVSNYRFPGMDSVIKFSPNGSSTTFASGLNRPQGLAFDHAGNLFVAAIGDTTNVILKFTPAGGQSVFAQPIAEQALAFDQAGNLYVDGSGCNCVRRYPPDATEINYASGIGSPYGMAFDGAGNLFVTSGTTEIVKIAPNGTRTIFAAGIGFPNGLAFDATGNLYVAASNDGVIYAFTPTGARSTFASGFPSIPVALAFDAVGNLFVSLGNGSILKIAPGGTQTLFASGLNAVPFLAFEPAAPVIDSIGRRSDGKVILHGHGVINAMNHVQASTSPNPASFVTIGNVFVGPSGWLIFGEDSSKFARRFYRITYP